MRINYANILAYIDWLNSKVPDTPYRLPTEAEWEYAARAGTTTRFAQGDDLTSDQAKFNGLLTQEYMGEKRPDLLTRGATVPVTALDAANPWGLRHMSGNIGEYTASCSTPKYLGWDTSSEWLANARKVGDACTVVVRRGIYQSNGL